MKKILSFGIILLFFSSCYQRSLNYIAATKDFSWVKLSKGELITKNEYLGFYTKKGDTTVYRQYFEKNLTDSIVTFQNSLNQKISYHKQWWDNGKKAFEVNYLNNYPKKLIRYNEFSHRPFLRTEQTFTNNGKNCLSKTFNANNIKISEYNYTIKHSEISVHKNYKMTPYNFSQGYSKNGSYKVYDSLGILNCTGIYENDSLMSKQCINKNLDSLKLFEEMPEFPGGDNELLKFLYGNIEYPIKAKKYNIQGLLISSFIVNKSGGIEDVEVLRGIDPSLKVEVLRILNQMPKWKPGYQNGKAVKVSYKLPVRFKLE